MRHAAQSPMQLRGKTCASWRGLFYRRRAGDLVPIVFALLPWLAAGSYLLLPWLGWWDPIYDALRWTGRFFVTLWLTFFLPAYFCQGVILMRAARREPREQWLWGAAFVAAVFGVALLFLFYIITDCFWSLEDGCYVFQGPTCCFHN